MITSAGSQTENAALGAPAAALAAAVEEIVAQIGDQPEDLIPLLLAIQRRFRWLPPAALAHLAKITAIPAAEISGVATFYAGFRHQPAGEHTIAVCVGTACHVKGADQVYAALRRFLAIPENSDTDPQGRFTVVKVNCLGCCTLAPAVKVDDITYGHMVPERVAEMLADFESQRSSVGWAEESLPASAEVEFRLSLGSCCQGRGSGRLFRTLRSAIAQSGIPASVKRVGCVGMCYQTPVVEVARAGRIIGRYGRLRAEDARRLALAHGRPASFWMRLREGAISLLDSWLSNADEPLEHYCLERQEENAAFARPQYRIVTEGCGEMDPLDLDEYLSRGGGEAWRRCCRELSPEKAIAEIEASGLRGRGGAGFPTGRKWRLARAAPGEVKYVIANGDEGDPGAFMDRMILESFPYRVLEGLRIAAWAVGAAEAILYIRAEYPLAVARVREAIRRCAERGIFDLPSAPAFRFRVAEGAGAFVCGEETALIASLEGRRGHPRLRPPYPAMQGFQGCPTLVNNVETLACVPWILRHGAAAFASLGTAASRGTKVFALAGKIRRGGLIEVPMGMTVQQVVEEIGGGVAQGRRFKAAQIGGPSGGCVPARLGHTPVDYEALLAVGAMMGSGGFVVLDDEDCMVDIARYFLAFTQAEACGRCAPCRIGTARLLELLQALCEGRAAAGCLEEIEALAHAIQATSLCGLGKTAPNPVLSTLRYFRDEYEAHLAGRCPAGRCRALVRYAIAEQCIGCALCRRACPVSAISGQNYEPQRIDPAVCVRCGTCRRLCPQKAIEIRSP
ncbi:MAG: NAD(P)H-dependent oxidoreductase subunit E [Planctomycetota bacterium]|nr:NAD(P)H-dependent oxidoreductase subunit E [Planctomycetota bacterium]